MEQTPSVNDLIMPSRQGQESSTMKVIPEEKEDKQESIQIPEERHQINQQEVEEEEEGPVIVTDQGGGQARGVEETLINDISDIMPPSQTVTAKNQATPAFKVRDIVNFYEGASEDMSILEDIATSRGKNGLPDDLAQVETIRVTRKD